MLSDRDYRGRVVPIMLTAKFEDNTKLMKQVFYPYDVLMRGFGEDPSTVEVSPVHSEPATRPPFFLRAGVEFDVVRGVFSAPALVDLPPSEVDLLIYRAQIERGHFAFPLPNRTTDNLPLSLKSQFETEGWESA